MFRNYLIVCTLALFSGACTSFSSSPASGVEDDYYRQQDGELCHNQIVLGERLQDPYEVSNVTKALESLYPTRAGRVEIGATDRYVRFLPSDYEQLRSLEELGLELIDHPLDYQIVVDGDYYHDPSVGEQDITWMYAVVPKDFQCPSGIAVEEIHDCYFPENDAGTKSLGSEIDWDAVERESFRLTGNEDLLCCGSDTRSADSDGCCPKGRITILDEDYDSEPVAVCGVKVCCNIFVKISTAYTDENGFYEMKRKFSSNPRYSLVFKNKKGFSLGLNLILVPASVSTLGRHNASGYDCTVAPGDDPALWRRCVVNNAGYDYYSNCRTATSSIKLPPSNLRVWMFALLPYSMTPMFQQGVIMNSDVVTSLLGNYTFLVKMFMPDIVLGLGGKESYESIYRTAIHELAHSSHYMAVGNDYWETFFYYMVSSWISSGGVSYGTGTEDNHGYCEVSEMWAYYLENAYVRDRYPQNYNYSGTSYWFFPQIFTYLDDRGLDRYRIFQAISGDVCDRETLRSRLISLYPEFKTSINEAFIRYY